MVSKELISIIPRAEPIITVSSSNDRRKWRQQIANAKYKKTPKAKQAAANYYQRRIEERKKTQLIWRNKCKARLAFLEEFYEKHKNQ